MDELERADLARHFHDLIRATVPASTYLAKYGGALYTMKPKENDRHFCAVYVKDDHVHFVFELGSRLRDPEKVLVGKNKFRRHIDFYSADQVEDAVIVALLRQAARR